MPLGVLEPVPCRFQERGCLIVRQPGAGFVPFHKTETEVSSHSLMVERAVEVIVHCSNRILSVPQGCGLTFVSQPRSYWKM